MIKSIQEKQAQARQLARQLSESIRIREAYNIDSDKPLTVSLVKPSGVSDNDLDFKKRLIVRIKIDSIVIKTVPATEFTEKTGIKL